MSNIRNSIYEIRFVDEMSQKDTFIHKLHPLVKLIVTVIYITTTVSYSKYEIIAMIPLMIYPIVVFNLSDIQFLPVFKRSLIVLPVVLGLGIFNPIMDKDAITIFANVSIAGGWISYLSLIIKCFLTVFCALLLISTTSIDKITMALRYIHVPKIIAMQFLFTYRYIYVLMEEFENMWTAYSLRAPGQRGVHYKSIGPLLGQLLMRTYDRAQRIYYCMVLRGYNGEYQQNECNLNLKDYIYLCIWTIFLFFIKYNNVPVILGNIMTGGQQ
ncbi:MAG: cobalt ECF transporter T component CbiQ [Sedimentibacter sp.]